MMAQQVEPPLTASCEPSADAEDLASEASFYHTALLLGLCRGERVVAWADHAIASVTEAPHALCDVALTDPRDLSAMRHAVAQLAPEAPSVATLARVLRVAAADLAEGRRDVTGTVQLFAQMRRMLTLPVAIEHDLDQLQDTHMLATAGVQGSEATAEALVRGWLAGFAAAGVC